MLERVVSYLSGAGGMNSIMGKEQKFSPIHSTHTLWLEFWNR